MAYSDASWLALIYKIILNPNKQVVKALLLLVAEMQVETVSIYSLRLENLLHCLGNMCSFLGGRLKSLLFPFSNICLYNALSLFKMPSIQDLSHLHVHSHVPISIPPAYLYDLITDPCRL